DAATYHNRYPEDWARLNREVIEEEGLLGEVVFFTRSGFTRSPGQSTLFWLGDQLTAWDREDGLASAVIGLLSSGMSGFSLNHGDVGGYTATTMARLPVSLPLVSFSRDRELLQRWTEMCAFTAVFRTHEGNQPGRNHQIGDDEETLAHFARFSRVYAALAPYREELFAEAAERGAPVVRHMWLEFPEERAVRDLEGQFMLGSQIVVAPVLAPGAATIRLFLPPGQWTHLWTGVTYDSPAGGYLYEVPCPIGEPAVFCRASWMGASALRETLTESGDLTTPG
ncbi:MAG: TIM-barrel domain-containing protein, partial [Myxococcota bacterium]|nr:TIM-barrel domain-containing protein [Myxococcota bacterium]